MAALGSLRAGRYPMAEAGGVQDADADGCPCRCAAGCVKAGGGVHGRHSRPVGWLCGSQHQEQRTDHCGCHSAMRHSWLPPCLPLFQNGPISLTVHSRCKRGSALLEASPYPGQRRFGTRCFFIECGRGGTGRRATLRSLWAKARGSSSLLDRTSKTSKAKHLRPVRGTGLRFCSPMVLPRGGTAGQSGGLHASMLKLLKNQRNLLRAKCRPRSRLARLMVNAGRRQSRRRRVPLRCEPLSEFE